MHCCEIMRNAIDSKCLEHPNLDDCPDNIIQFISKFNEYGIPIRDGGSSKITIKFCPWCGKKLPESMRDKWFNEMESRGIDPWSDDIPKEFETGEWIAIQDVKK